MIELTAKEREALLWLTRDGSTVFDQSQLAGLYEERLEAKRQEEGFAMYIGARRYQSWCRTSSSVMCRLADKGVLTRFPRHYRWEYTLTDAGKAALGSPT